MDDAKNKKKISGLGLVFLGLSVIGGSFFLGSGLAIEMAGPSVMLGYVIGGIITYLMLVSLGHLALKYKERESFRGYVQEVIGPVGGFVVGWAAWFTAVVAMTAESIAMSIYTRQWFPAIPLWMLALFFGFLATGINFYGIKVVNRSERILTILKTGALLAFTLVVSYILITPHHVKAGTGAANLTPFLPHGLSGLMQGVVICTFAYGVGAFAAATGDTRNPERDVPFATKGMAASQAFFFIVPTLVLLLAVPWSAISTKSSPFVTALNHVGIHAGGSVLNIVVLIASFSALVASMFSAKIMLSSMAEDREAPALLAKKWHDLSLYALLTSAGALFILILLTQLLPKGVYNYAVTTSGYFSFITWGSILLARMMLCLPQKNGTMEWSGFTIAAIGLASVILISVLSLKAPEQKYSFFLTVGILLLLMIIGKAAIKKKGDLAVHAPVNGEPKQAFIFSEKKTSRLLNLMKGKLQQK